MEWLSAHLATVMRQKDGRHTDLVG